MSEITQKSWKATAELIYNIEETIYHLKNTRIFDVEFDRDYLIYRVPKWNVMKHLRVDGHMKTVCFGLQWAMKERQSNHYIFKDLHYIKIQLRK